jgi:hypothetical protein
MLHAGIQAESNVDATDYKPAGFEDGDPVSVFDADGNPFGGSSECAFAGVAQVSKP